MTVLAGICRRVAADLPLQMSAHRHTVDRKGGSLAGAGGEAHQRHERRERRTQVSERYRRTLPAAGPILCLVSAPNALCYHVNGGEWAECSPAFGRETSSRNAEQDCHLDYAERQTGWRSIPRRDAGGAGHVTCTPSRITDRSGDVGRRFGKGVSACRRTLRGSTGRARLRKATALKTRGSDGTGQVAVRRRRRCCTAIELQVPKAEAGFHHCRRLAPDGHTARLGR
jgi:hypothetical protein